MVPGVASDGVAGGDERARDLGLLLDEFPEEEESRLHAVALEDLHHAPGVGIIGAVVVGERQQARAAGQADERRAVHLRGRPHGLEARPGRDSGEAGGGDEPWQHWHDCSVGAGR